MLTSRPASSLAELLVALSLAALVLGSATVTVLRQQRSTTRTTSTNAADSQLHPMMALVPAELGSLVSAAGDLAAGQASDTSLQLRVPIALAVQCDSAAGSVAWRTGGSEIDASGMAALPHVGDSLWSYDPASSAWVGRRVVASLAGTGTCPGTADSVPVRRLRHDGLEAIPVATPLRLTRQVRYDIYRAADGSWQLGLRDWSEASGRFASPQPLAGPLLRPAGGGVTSGFRYFDATGAELPPSAVDVRRVARLRFTAISVRGATTSPSALVRDSVDVALLPLASP